MNYTELMNRIEELKSRKGRGSISADETFSLLMELAEKTRAVDINAGSLTVRRVYLSVAAMNADKNPVDQETGKPLKFGQLVCACNPNNQASPDNGKIYRYNKPGWEFLRQVGDMVQFATTDEVNGKVIQLDENINNARLEMFQLSARTNWFKYPKRELTDGEKNCISVVKSLSFYFPLGEPEDWDGYAKITRISKPGNSDSGVNYLFLLVFDGLSINFIALRKGDEVYRDDGDIPLTFQYSGFDKPIVVNIVLNFSIATVNSNAISMEVNINTERKYSTYRAANYPFVENVSTKGGASNVAKIVKEMDLTAIPKRDGCVYGVANCIVSPYRFFLSIKYTRTGLSLNNAITEVYFELLGSWGYGKNKFMLVESVYSATGNKARILINPYEITTQGDLLNSPVWMDTALLDDVFTTPNKTIQLYAESSPVEISPTDIFLPPVIYTAKGKLLNIYYDSITVLPETGKEAPIALFDVTGVAYERRYIGQVYNTVGNYPLSVSIINESMKVVSNALSTIQVVNNLNPDSKKYILCLGDSTTDDNLIVTKTLQENLADYGGITPEFIGTHGKSPWKHEARTGKDFSYYVNGITVYKFTVRGMSDAEGDLTPLWWYYVGSSRSNGYILVNQEISIDASGNGYVIAEIWSQPSESITNGWSGILQKGGYGGGPDTITVTNTEIINGYSIMKNNNGIGILDFSYYMNKFNSGKSCDILCVDLGVNDIRNYNYTFFRQGISAIIDNAKKLFEAYFSYNPKGKIVVCIPKSCASDNRVIGNYTHNRYRVAMQHLRQAIVGNFYNSAFKSGIFICPSGICYDRWYGYNIESVKLSERYDILTDIHNDTIHLSDNGYKQVADAMTGTLLHVLNL